MTTYKELLMKRDAFLELRTMIRNALAAHPATSGGVIFCMDLDGDTSDLIVSGQYGRGDAIVKRKHRITITEEPYGDES